MPLYVYLAASSVVAAFTLLWWAVAANRAAPSWLVGADAIGVGSSDLREIQLGRSAHERIIDPLVAGLARRARRVTPVGMVDALERRVVLAGKAGSLPIEKLLAGKLALAMVGIVIAIGRVAEGFTAANLFVALLLVGITYTLPDLFLARLAEHRQQQIRQELPDVIDQLAINVEAGLGFEAAMAQAARSGKGPLSRELSQTLQDLQIGLPRRTALEHLLARTEVPDLKHFVAAVKQAEQYGVPIAQVLRVQSKELREKRRARAEESAMKLPVKIIFPVLFCILPALFIVILGPAAMRIYDSFASGG